MSGVAPSDLSLDDNQILFWNLHRLDFSRPPQEQGEALKTDLGQAVLAKGVLLDIGWYPALDPTGSFVVLVVREGEWEDPISRETATDWASLKQSIALAVVTAKMSELDRRR